LQRLPEMPSAESSPLFNQDSSLATPLVFSNFVANYGSLVPDNYQVQSEGQTSPSAQPVNQVQSEGKPSPSDQVVNIQDLADDCAQQTSF
jgi:hypothetical protein